VDKLARGCPVAIHNADVSKDTTCNMVININHNGAAENGVHIWAHPLGITSIHPDSDVIDAIRAGPQNGCGFREELHRLRNAIRAQDIDVLPDAPKGYRKAEHRPKRIAIGVYMTR
jgi:hypothetical protein